MKRPKETSLIEWGKNILILLLIGSMLWILVHSSVMRRPIEHLLGKRTQEETIQQQPNVGWMEAVRPLRMVATLMEGGQVLRCGYQYDQSRVDTVFQSAAPLLAQALSNGTQPEQILVAQWETALQQAPGLCFDFQGAMPLSVLLEWLSGKELTSDLQVRRILLTGQGGTLTLYYEDAERERYYQGTVDSISVEQLEYVLAPLRDNGAFYAFESEAYAVLEPNTLLTPNTSTQLIYTAENPMSAGRSDLELLIQDLGFALSACSFYSADEEVVRCGSETVRLSNSGVVEYRAGEYAGDHFRLPVHEKGHVTPFMAVELCRNLLSRVMNNRCGEAQLYLRRMETHIEGGWRITFDYALNGSHVALETGNAAEFYVENGEITSFTLRLRRYTQTGETTPVLPSLQAAAAVQAMQWSGRELLLIYQDRGEEQVTASWAVAQNGKTMEEETEHGMVQGKKY